MIPIAFTTNQNSLAQARTGTGKTLAFLIPVLQRIINSDPSLERRRGREAYDGRSRQAIRGPDIRAIIVSPTRELAEQIANEARKITSGTGVVVQTAVGGTGKAFGLRRIKEDGCHILVATPGRLHDILSDPYSGVQAPNLDAFVLDEADRLLDVGFAPEIHKISDLLPPPSRSDRQTLMFSATVPEGVMEMVRRYMRPDYRFVQTVQPGEQQTHERVPQKIVYTTGFETMLPSLLEVMRREQARTDANLPFKALVFFNANAEATLAAAIFQSLKSYNHRRTPIVEMHSRLSQAQRTRASETFRRATSAVMFSSDVSARGMDFPNVTHVIQMGLPRDTETYVHRLGRTARGDKQGEGWLFVSPLERRETKFRLEKMPLQEDTSLEVPKVDMTQDSQLPGNVAACLTEIIEATRTVDEDVKAEAYRATLGVYSWYSRKNSLVESMNRRAIYGWGMEHPPGIALSLATRLGIAKTPGVNIVRSSRGAPSMREWMGRDDDMPSRSRGGRQGAPPSYGERRSSYRDRSSSYGERRSSYGERRSSYGERKSRTTY